MNSPAQTKGFEADSADLIARLEANIAQIIRGKPEAIRSVVLALVARGHVLIEDVPGVGKTTLARATAATIGGTFHRIQFTSDLLPSDIIGVSILDEKSGRFEFKPGAIFANVVLADEINRTAPRTQSALLEAMNDTQVSVEGKSHPLPEPFMVIATQNPEEHFGTYPLPESQMDRFSLRIRIDYPAPEDEKAILMQMTQGASKPLRDLKPAMLINDILSLQSAAEKVRLSEEMAQYIVAVAGETRKSPLLSLGVSTRGQIAWRNIARAVALSDGRDFVIPDDLKDTAVSVLSHRVILAGQGNAGMGGRNDAERVIDEIVNHFPVPG